MDDLEYRVSKLELGPGDILIVKVDRELRDDVAERIRRNMGRVVGSDVRVWILMRGVDISVLTRAEIESMTVQHEPA